MALKHVDISNFTASITITPTESNYTLYSLLALPKKKVYTCRKYLLYHTPSQRLNPVDSIVTSYNGLLLLELKKWPIDYIQFVEPTA